jgi:diacylglycerol kinase family enzyme
MMPRRIDVIATTISGSVRDWGKVKQIVPLFAGRGENDVHLVAVDSHQEARRTTCELVRSGSRIIISAGGSGTFNSVLEGCYDAQVDLAEVRLGFLRKGSADLIGKVLQMPDQIEPAIEVFVNSIRKNLVVPCDVILAQSAANDSPPRRFVGYGGAEIFGEIPYFTENRFIKYYKGILSQLFGDLGPFFVGTSLALGRRIFRRPGRKRSWMITVDGKAVTAGRFQTMIIVNGDLGPNLPFARGVPLGSGDFWLFTIRDLGLSKIFRQLKHAWDASILEHPDLWGFESFCVKKSLKLQVEDRGAFPINTDGSTMQCRDSVTFQIIGQIRLLAKEVIPGN